MVLWMVFIVFGILMLLSKMCILCEGIVVVLQDTVWLRLK
jgi:hypothetical protein